MNDTAVNPALSPEKALELKIALLKAIKTHMGDKPMNLGRMKEELVVGKPFGYTTSYVAQVRDDCRTSNLIKVNSAGHHQLTHEGENWLSMHLQDEASTKPKHTVRMSGTIKKTKVG